MSRIGIDARMYGPNQTGIGIYIQHLIEGLAKLDSPHDFFLFMREPYASEYKPTAPNFHTVHAPEHWYSYAEQATYPWRLMAKRLDLMHFPHFNSPVLYPGKTVLTVHDLTPKFDPGKTLGRKWWKRVAYDTVLKRATNKAHAIIAPSQFTKHDATIHLGIPPEKVHVVYEGIKGKITPEQQQALQDDYPAYKQQAFEQLRRYSPMPQLRQPFIFYTGVWRSHKNLVRLVDAFYTVRKDYGIDATLVMGGKRDPNYPEAEQRIRALGLQPYVITPGYIPEEALGLFYAAADVFALPSLYEGFGLVAVEALNFGAPVAASRQGPLPEVVRDGALYFNPHDTGEMAAVLARIVQDKQLQEQLVHNGQQVIVRYSWDTMARNIHAIYEQALKT